MTPLPDNPLRPLVEAWTALIQQAKKHRTDDFGEVAHDCFQFYYGTRDWLYKHKSPDKDAMQWDNIPSVTFKTQFNKVAELVQLFAPTMYYRNPLRHVLPKRPDIPLESVAALYGPEVAQQVGMMGQFATEKDKITAGLLYQFLNYTPNELGLKAEAQRLVVDGLIAGRGVMWHAYHTPESSPQMVLPHSYFRPWSSLLLDPDAETVKKATWCAEEVTEPIWKFARERGLNEQDIKRRITTGEESAGTAAEYSVMPDFENERRRGTTTDLVTYYKVYSKCGFGNRLKVAGDNNRLVEGMAGALERFGDNVYLEIVPGLPYPANVPPSLMQADLALEENQRALIESVRWPIPFYLDNGEWPFTELDFHTVPGKLWPMAHMKPCLPYVKFLNWTMSFLMGRIEKTSRMLVGVAQDLEKAVQDAIEAGDDTTVVPFNNLVHDKGIKGLMDIITFPEVNPDLWRIAEFVLQQFDKASGLSELIYGMSGKQMRSASEAQLKQQAINIRPDDMADRVEDHQSRVARKEAIMARWASGPETVAPIFNETFDRQTQQIGPMTRLWTEHVYQPLNLDDQKSLERVLGEFHYTIQAGSIRKPNLERDQENLDQMGQSFGPLMFQYYQATGDPTQLNTYLRQWGKLRQMDDIEQMLFPDMRQMMQQQQMQPQPEAQPV